MINLVFLLDITGSMQSELEGVKETVHQLVASVFEEEYAVMITIITFTENAGGCYVTSHSFTEGEEAAAFVKSIKLCVPPGTDVNANGGDGDENQKAAFVQLLTLDNSMPTIAFLITDAGPHLVADRQTPEARHEATYLKSTHGIPDPDMFNVLALVQAHFDGNLVLNVVKYVKNSDHRMYGCIAAQFDGVLIEPTVRSSTQLAAGLMAILSKMFERFAGGAAMDIEAEEAGGDIDAALNAFILYDLSKFSTVICEADVYKENFPVAGSTGDLLFAFLERATVVVGDRFAKRAITASGLREQVELLLVIAKCLAGKLGYNDALDRSTALVDKIYELMPEENRSHFKISAATLPALLQQKIETTASSKLDAAVSAITLLTTQEAAEDALESENDESFDPATTLQTAAGLFFVHLAVLRLPMKNGKPDFMDAWSAVVSGLSNDILTASDFLMLIGSEEATTGLRTCAREYNYAQLVADPHDTLGSALLRVASGTQVLDILTALLAGAPAGRFCPNMFRGTTAASLMALLNQRDGLMSSFQWGLAAKLVHSIRLIMGGRKSLTELEVDPEAATGKLLFQLLRCQKTGKQDGSYDADALRLVLQEELATRVHKSVKYNQQTLLTMVETMVGYTHSDLVEDVFQAHTLDGKTWTFDVLAAQEFAATTPFFREFERSANNLIRAVVLPIKLFASPEADAPTLCEVWPTCTDELPKFLLLQKRSARFTINREGQEDATAKLNWQRNGVMDEALNSSTYTALAMQVLRKKHEGFMKELQTRRQDAAAEKEWQLALKTARAPSLDAYVSRVSLISSDTSLRHKLLCKALKQLASTKVKELDVDDYEVKVQVLVTGRLVTADGTSTIVFNRGNLNAHPDKVFLMAAAFKARLRMLRREHGWSLGHTYRDGVPNNNGYSNENPSKWALKRSSTTETFWELED